GAAAGLVTEGRRLGGGIVTGVVGAAVVVGKNLRAPAVVPGAEAVLDRGPVGLGRDRRPPPVDVRRRGGLVANEGGRRDLRAARPDAVAAAGDRAVGRVVHGHVGVVERVADPHPDLGRLPRGRKARAAHGHAVGLAVDWRGRAVL